MKKKHSFTPTTRELCLLGMLTAVTAILSIVGTFRVGNFIKVPTKFIPVFLSSALFHPLWGGTVAAIGDILNCAFVPVGPWNPLLTGIEFLNGVLYGVCFYGYRGGGRSYALRCAVCVLLLAASGVFLTTPVLVSMGYLPGFVPGLLMRIPGIATNAVLHALVLGAGYFYLPFFKKRIGKN